MTDTQRKAMKLSDEILQLIDSAEEMTRGDLQGCAEALAMKYLAKDTAMVKISHETAQAIMRFCDVEVYELHDDGSESLVDELEPDRQYGIEGEVFASYQL